MWNKVRNFLFKNKKLNINFCVEVFFIILVLLFDLLTKKYIYGKAQASGDIVIIPKILCFTAVENTGASFGILKNSTKFLSYISLFSVILLFAFMIFSLKDRNIVLRASLVLITAGGLGNLVDRFKYGYVRDFVSFTIKDWSFAVFNFADSALTIGCILAIIWVIFYFSKKTKDEKDAESLDHKEDADLDNHNF